MASEDSFQQRFNELRHRAKRGTLSTEERPEYDDLKERFARAICNAQNTPLRPDQTARKSFRVAALYKVEIALGGATHHKTATLDISAGGFSVLLERASAVGTEVSFKLVLSSKGGTVAGRGTVASSVKERGGSQFRVSVTFREIPPAEAALLEEALFDAVILRSMTPPTAFLVGPPTPTSFATDARPAESERITTPAPAPVISAALKPPTPVSLRPVEAPKMVEAPKKKVEDLVDAEVREMRGASEAAQREEVLRGRPTSPEIPIEIDASAAFDGRDDDAPSPRDTPGYMVTDGETTYIGPRPSNGRSSVLFVGAVLVASLAAAGVAVRLAHPSVGATAPRAAATSTAPATPAPTPAQPPATTTPPAASAEAPAAAPVAVASPPPNVGIVKVTAGGHRVFIDGRLAGDGPGAFSVSCGRHRVRIGSSGATRAVDVPCGAEVEVGRR